MHDDKNVPEENESPRDKIVMESLGTVPEDSPDYIEADDISNAIADGDK